MLPCLIRVDADILGQGSRLRSHSEGAGQGTLPFGLEGKGQGARHAESGGFPESDHFFKREGFTFSILKGIKFGRSNDGSVIAEVVLE
jgi:hypothetical protein